MDQSRETEYYSVALIGSSGGGTATLGHTDPVGVLTAIHHELLQIRDDVPVTTSADDDGSKPRQKRINRVCIGISHAIFVSLCDGGGFDSIADDDWKSSEAAGLGPEAALFTVGFDDSSPPNHDSNNNRPKFRVGQLARGPLSQINARVQKLDKFLSSAVTNNQNRQSSIQAIISLSSKPSLYHNTLSTASALNLPVTGFGGTSLALLASTYNLRIVGNSGGSVASTTLTKARGCARGLAVQWGMVYDSDYTVVPSLSTIDTEHDRDKKDVVNVVPSLKSILEATLPAFLFICLMLRFLAVWSASEDENDDGQSCSDPLMQRQQPVHALEYVLENIALGTTGCVLSAMSRSHNSTKSGGDQSTLLLAATLAGVITSASASLSSNITSCKGGSALAGLIAGACIPPVMSTLSNFCIQYHVTATSTNILLGGGVGIFVGVVMHLSGLAYGLGLMTGVVRCLLRWKRLDISDNESVSWPIQGILGALESMQQYWSDLATSSPKLSTFFYNSHALLPTSRQLLPVPIGLGFLCGCTFVYGSKIGWYHSIFLPLILLEMDGTADASLLGAMDECTLVMVCAGICAGNLIAPPPNSKGVGSSSLSWQALKTNILCGDFIEAAYPYMDKSMLVNGSAYLAAGLSCEILMQRRVLGSAYFPLPLVIWLSSDRLGMAVACALAFSICFVGTVSSNLFFTRHHMNIRKVRDRNQS